MNEHKNTILALVLMGLVIIGWQYFVGYPQMERQRQEAQLKQQSPPQPSSTQPATPSPNAAQPATPEVPGTPKASAPSAQTHAASREAVIASSPRIAIETPRLGGSIDLKGGRIDDLTLTQYREQVDPKSPPIVLFSPSGAPDAFYAEFGWVPAGGINAAMPGPETVWKQQSTNALGIGHPVTLIYDNGQGLVFTRTISVDEHYLFTIKDAVKNNGI